MSDPARLLRLVFIVLAAAAVLHSGVRFWQECTERQAIDFYIYYVAAHLDDRADIDNIYDPDVQHRVGEEEYARALQGSSQLHAFDAMYRRRLDNVSSPFLYTCLTWLPYDYELALGIYRALLIVSFAAAVVMIGTAAGLPWAANLFLCAALLRFFVPFQADTMVGNVSSFQLLAIALFIVVGRRFPVAGGAIIGLLIAFKPTVLWLVVLLVVSRVAARDFPRLQRELSGGVLGGLFAFVAASINFGTPRVWVQWLPVAGGFYGRLAGRDSNNVAPALPLFERFGPSLSLAIALILLGAIAALLFRRRCRDDVLLAGLGALVYLLSAPVVWLGYLSLAIPVAYALFRKIGTSVVALAALVALSGQWLLLAGKSPLPLDARVVPPALLALFAASLWLLFRSPTNRGVQLPS